MDFQFSFNHKLKGILRASTLVLICLSLLVLLAACGSKTVIRPLDYSRPSEQSGESQTEETSQTKKEAKKSEATSKKTEETTYDLSKEFNPGNLQALAGGGFKNFAGAENGPGVAGLATAVNQFLQEKGLAGAGISIAYQDLTTNELYTLNADARYQSASVIKVAVAMVVGQLMDQGHFPADMQIVYLPSEWFSADNMDPAQEGKLVSMQGLVDSALLYSDNAATSAIFAYFDRHGCLLHNFLDARTGTHYAGDVTMSAREGLGLITQLYYDSEFPSYKNILTTMTSSTWNEFLTKNIPVAVSSKYGNLAGLNHEIGLVWSDRPFAYSVFTQNVGAYDVLPALGSLLYQYNTGSLAPAQPSATPPGQAGQPPAVPSQPGQAPGVPGQTGETSPPPLAP